MEEVYMARAPSRCEWGAGQKTKSLQASLIDFCFFLPISAGWDHPRQSGISGITCSPTAQRQLVAKNHFKF
jgi:hypothetical protein